MKPFLSTVTQFFANGRAGTGEPILYTDKGIHMPLEFSSDSKIKVLLCFGQSQVDIRESVLKFIDQLDEDKYHILAAGPKGDIIDELKDRGLVTFLLDIGPGIRLFRDYWIIRRLKRTLNEEKITIIHAHNYKPALLSGLAARMAKTPIVLFTLHNYIIDEGVGRFRHLFFDITERFLPSLADKIITVSDALRRRVIDKGRAENSKVTRVYTGIKPPPHSFVSKNRISSTIKLLSLRAGAPVIVSVSPLTPQKGIKYLLIAATHILREVPNAQFVIVGDGPSKHDLQIIAEKFGIHKKVTFTGWRDDVMDIIAIADIFVAPALTEGFPTMVLEAMSLSKPVVATAVGGIPEVIVDRETGLLVRPKKPMLLAQAITFLLTNKDTAVHLGVSGRSRVEEEFELKKSIKTTRGIYSELVDGWLESEEKARQAALKATEQKVSGEA